MSNTLAFLSWVPEPVVEMAKELYAGISTIREGHTEAQQILLRLISDPRMQRVWQELFKRKRVGGKTTEAFLYPACVTYASEAVRNRRRAADLRKKGGPINEFDANLLEAIAASLEPLTGPPIDPRWSEQGRGAQLFLYQAYHDALHCEPIFLADLQAKASKLRSIAQQLRDSATTLQLLTLTRDARKLQEIASHCDQEAMHVLPSESIGLDEDPWVIRRKTGDLRLRTYVVNLSLTTVGIFEKYLYSALATVANVVFDRSDITATNVREMLRHPNSSDSNLID